jgi:hypothetical protein
MKGKGFYGHFKNDKNFFHGSKVFSDKFRKKTKKITFLFDNMLMMRHEFNGRK